MVYGYQQKKTPGFGGGVPSPGLGGTTDWTATPEANTTVGGIKPPKKKKRTKGTPPGVTPPGTTQGPAGLGGTPSTVQSGQSIQGMDNSIAGVTYNAPSGSFAGGINSPSIPGLAANPGAANDLWYNQQYGLGPGSNASQLGNEYWNASDKQYGVLGGGYLNDVDMINFGAQLQNAFATSMGKQLDPASMVTNILQSLQDEAKGGATGGFQGALGEIVHNPDPNSAISSLLSILRGALHGTMPDDSVDAYLNYVARIATTYAQQTATSPDGVINSSKPGGDIGSYLIKMLGPSGGL